MAVNESLTILSINGLLVSGATLFATTGYPFLAPSSVWRLSLPEIVGWSAVSQNVRSTTSLRTYPNPFTEFTTISLTLSSAGYAEISIANLLGVEVAHVFSGELDASEHRFTFDASKLSPGMYECILRMNGRTQSVPIVVE
jgi:hypothetical protein